MAERAADEDKRAQRDRAGLRQVLESIDRRLARLISILESSGIVRGVAILATLAGFAVVIGTAWQIWNDYGDRREDRIDRAWTRLLRPLGGNSGKADAFEFLVRAGLSLSNTNLSCRLIGTADAATGQCLSAPVFQGLQIGPSGDGTRMRVENIDFSGDRFVELGIAGVWMKNVNLDGASIEGLTVAGSYFGISGAPTISVCKLPGSVVPVEAFLDKASYCNYSNTAFIGSAFIAGVPQGVAWADAPPYLILRPLKPGLLNRVEMRVFSEAFPEPGLGISLCAVPNDDSGKPLPLDGRQNAPCQFITLDEARGAYPALYPTAGTMSDFMHDGRWSAMLLASVQDELNDRHLLLN